MKMDIHLYKHNKLLITLIALLPLVSYSQDKRINLKKKFDYSGWQRTFNRSFASILGATGSNNSIGNYASFDAVAGSFSFKGTLPIGNPDSSLNFLSLSLQGDIASDNIAKLFEDSKINTNTSVKGEYHIILSIKNIEREKEREEFFNLQDLLIQKRRDMAFDNSELELKKNKNNLNLVQTEKEVIILFRNRQANAVKLVTEKIDSLRYYTTKNFRLEPDFVDSLSKHTSKLSKALIKFDSLNNLLDKKQLIEDSLIYTINKWTYLKRRKLNGIDEKLKITLDSLKDVYLFSSYQLTWITGVGSIGKKKYYSFDGKLPFNQQISENDLLTNSYGVAINIYKRNETFKRSRFINIGILHSFDNNAYLKSTTDVSQDITFKNSVGDTIRKVTQKYSAYTEPITSTKQFSTYANFYYLSGNNSIGIHFFPSYYKASGFTGYANVGIGFIAAFKNMKKDNPIINLEAYVQFKDLFNSLVVDSKFYNRNEIGARFTLPFNFF